MRREEDAKSRPKNQKISQKRLEFLRREERQNKFESMYKILRGETKPKESRVFEEKEACQRQAYKPKETPKETNEFLRR